MSHIRNLNYVVELPGIPLAMRPMLEEEIRKVTNYIARAAKNLDIPVLLQRVRLYRHRSGCCGQQLITNAGEFGLTRFIGIHKVP